MTAQGTVSRAAVVVRRRIFLAFCILPIAVVVVLVVYPLIRTGIQTAGEHAGGSPLAPFSERSTLTLLKNTLILVVASGFLSLLIGSFLAWLNERTDARMGSISDSLPLVPFFLPPLAGAIGWVLLLSPRAGLANAALRWCASKAGVKLNDGPLNIFSWWGLIFVLAMYLVPYVYMMVSAGLRNVDPRIEEQARMSGSGMLRTAIRVTLPAVKPSIGGAVMLVTWVAMSLVSVPAIIGTGARIDVLSVHIATLLTFSYPPRTGEAVGLCLVMVVVCGGLWLLQRRMLKSLRFSTLGGKGHTSSRMRLGPWRWVARAGMIAYLLLAAVLPLLALILVTLRGYWSPTIDWGALNLDALRQVLSDDETRTALRNSLILAVTGACVGVVLAALIAYVAKTTRTRGIQIADGIVKLPAIIPTLVLAVAILSSFGGTPFYLNGTISILLIAYLVVALPEATVAADAAAAQVGDELTDASRMSGGLPGRTFLRVFAPLMLPGLVVGWAFIFVRILGDFNASVILSGTENPVVGSYIYTVYNDGSYATLAALSCILCILSLVVAGGVALLARRLGARTNG